MKDKSNYKILVAHPAQQHSYSTVTALKKAGYDVKYATTVYDKKNSLTRLIKKILKGDNLKRANTRKSIDLEENDVVQFCELYGLILLLIRRIDPKKLLYHRWYNLLANKFNRSISRYVIKNSFDMIITYDMNSEKAYEILCKKAPHIVRLLDMSAPSLIFTNEIFTAEIRKDENESKGLLGEIKGNNHLRNLKRAQTEIKLANYYLVASDFSKRSLLYSGIPEDKIFKCVYGIDTVYFNGTMSQNYKKRLDCIFIGNVTQKKGCKYLFEAIDRLDENRYSFTILGNYDKNGYYYTNYGKRCNFTGHVTKDKVIQYLQKSDVLIFPSLADGFGFSVLEALSCYVPVIVSNSAGISDIIIDGYNGFVVPSSNSDEIYRKIVWLDNNRELLSKMKCNARETALNLTWDNYNKCLDNVIEKIMKGNRSIIQN